MPDRGADLIEHKVPAAKDDVIWDAQNAVTICAQPAITKGVTLALLLAVMRWTIKFDDQAMGGTKKIDTGQWAPAGGI